MFKIVKSDQVPSGMDLLIDEYEATDFLEEDGTLTCYTEVGLVYRHVESGDWLCDFICDGSFSFSSSDLLELSILLKDHKG